MKDNTQDNIVFTLALSIIPLFTILIMVYTQQFSVLIIPICAIPIVCSILFNRLDKVEQYA